MTTYQKVSHTLSSEALATLSLSLLPGVGAGRIQQWLQEFGSASALLAESAGNIPHFPKAAKPLLQNYQQAGDNSELSALTLTVQQKINEQKAQIITLDDPNYPDLLKRIHRPPAVLYAKGNTDLLYHPQIAIVGTRNPTHTGLANTRNFARYLADNGFTITSGLALGIDGAAHQAAAPCLGKTIAVMATGIDDIYPKRHRQLAQDIVDHGGLLLSEFAPESKAVSAHFPQRNRIISGLSLGVLLVEATLKSGSLITAQYALEQDREIFCLPGSIHNPQSKGCHQLIKQGAHLVETAADIVQEFGKIRDNSQKLTDENTQNPLQSRGCDPTEEKILQAIGHEAQPLDKIIERTELAAEQVSTQLMMLELKGLVKQSAWGYERCLL